VAGDGDDGAGRGPCGEGWRWPGMRLTVLGAGPPQPGGARVSGGRCCLGPSGDGDDGAGHDIGSRGSGSAE
jgi:hypothetical protein